MSIHSQESSGTAVNEPTTAEHRKKMLTVQKLIDYLKTCNPDACVLAFEINSNAYVEQFPELPGLFTTVAEDKKRELEWLNRFYKDSENKEYKVQTHFEELYRYAKDDDIVITL